MSKKPLKVIAGAPDKPLIVGEIEILCYVLENELRVLSLRSVTAGIGINPDTGFRMPQFMATKALQPYITEDLMLTLNSPIVFKNPSGGGIAHGYPATVLVEICNAVLAARDADALQKQQIHIAERCDLLIRGLATVGIIALVDEATGYQEVRAQRALATILEKFIDKELQPWTKTFPYEFYEQIYRLKGWQGARNPRRPSVIGHYTNDIVYSRLAPGLRDELKRRNPTLPSGARKNRHHQWFTPEFGHPKLKEHLAAVTAFMRAAPNWGAFERNLERAFPKFAKIAPPIPMNDPNED